MELPVKRYHGELFIISLHFMTLWEEAALLVEALIAMHKDSCRAQILCSFFMNFSTLFFEDKKIGSFRLFFLLFEAKVHRFKKKFTECSITED